jgi:hypothetical protein
VAGDLGGELVEDGSIAEADFEAVEFDHRWHVIWLYVISEEDVPGKGRAQEDDSTREPECGERCRAT